MRKRNESDCDELPILLLKKTWFYYVHKIEINIISENYSVSTLLRSQKLCDASLTSNVTTLTQFLPITMVLQ